MYPTSSNSMVVVFVDFPVMDAPPPPPPPPPQAVKATCCKNQKGGGYFMKTVSNPKTYLNLGVG